jgi:hypothetical protein
MKLAPASVRLAILSGYISLTVFTTGCGSSSNVPAPLPVTGKTLVAVLMSSTANDHLSQCNLNGASYSITPTFRLTPITLSAEPAGPNNGKVNAIHGKIASVNSKGNAINLVTIDGVNLTLKASGQTIYQGVNGFEALAAGMALELDAAVEPDGSLLSTRVAVIDADPTNITIGTGPVMFVGASTPGNRLSYA